MKDLTNNTKSKKNEQEEKVRLLVSKFSNDKVDIENVTAQIRQLIEQSAENENDDNEGALSIVWGNLITIATETKDENQAYLIDALLRLKNLPIAAKTRQYWQISSLNSYPIFGPIMRETLDTTLEENQDNYCNFCTFFAKLTRFQEEYLDFTLFSLWIIREAFEEKEIEKVEEISIKVAAIVMIYASSVLWSKTKLNFKEQDRSDIVGNYAKDVLSKDFKGFHFERWEFWKSSFNSISKNKIISEQVQESCKQAFNLMNAAEEVQ